MLMTLQINYLLLFFFVFFVVYSLSFFTTKDTKSTKEET